jgi:phosphoribosylglycinamide formyltransferase-1
MIRKRVGVLISGRGSNMLALVEAARAPSYPAEIVCVVSNRPDASGLGFAKAEGITTSVIDHTQFSKRETFDAALNAYLQSQKLDIIACAGFMRIMTPVLIDAWAGRMINIHPSLLPLYKGTHTHERALADGAKVHGCTVHYVSHELDAGSIIAQTQVIVFADDTLETLAARVLAQEHKLYPKALTRVCVALDKAKD